MAKTIQKIAEYYLMYMKRIPKIMFKRASVIFPDTRIVFLPKYFKVKNAKKVNKNWTTFIMKGV